MSMCLARDVARVKTLPLLLAVLFLSAHGVLGSKILFVLGPYTHSYNREAMEPLANKLADRGHKVTFFGPRTLRVGEEHPNVFNYDNVTLLNSINVELQTKYTENAHLHEIALKDVKSLFGTSIKYCYTIYADADLQKWVKKGAFDLFIIDRSTMAECAYVLAFKFKAKVMGFVPFGHPLLWDIDYYGIPPETTWIPSFLTFEEDENGDVSPWDRLAYDYTRFRWHHLHRDYYLSELDRKVIQREFAIHNPPPILSMIQRETIMLLNVHYSDSYPRPLPPCVIPVGGMHVHELQGLNGELKEFLDGAEEGFIYVDLGNMANFFAVQPKYPEMIMGDMGKQDLRFLWLWKHPRNRLPEAEKIPPNIRISSSRLDNDVLAHPKVRGYMTHGNQVSVQRAIYHGVPMLLFPMNSEQEFNAVYAKRLGVGLLFYSFTDSLAPAIGTITSLRVIKRVKEVSKMSKDRPMSGLDTAVWWTEFVLRNEATTLQQLHPESMRQDMWMRMSLDIVAMVLGYFFFFVTFAILTLYFVFKNFQLWQKHKRMRRTLSKTKFS